MHDGTHLEQGGDTSFRTLIFLWLDQKRQHWGFSIFGCVCVYLFFLCFYLLVFFAQWRARVQSAMVHFCSKNEQVTFDGFHRLVTSSSLPTNLSHVEEETSFLSQQLHSPKSESASTTTATTTTRKN